MSEPFVNPASDPVRQHYELYPYPDYSLIASIRRCDTYAINLAALWARFNGELISPDREQILIAGCGSFSPYPFALANPKAAITALDLSAANIRRARWHCLLHGLTNVHFQVGDLLNTSFNGNYALIDAYGVLHHLEDPLAGLRALASQLQERGILRIMLYSRYARRSEESIRRAFRMLELKDLPAAKKLIRRARKGSRLASFCDDSFEAGFDSGLADALLHPRVKTYRIDELLDLVSQSGLQPLLFSHDGASEDPAEEIERLRLLEKQQESPGNFVLYLGRNVKGPCNDAGSIIGLNPCLQSALLGPKLRKLKVADRLGQPNPPLGHTERRFLRQFRQAVFWQDLAEEAQSFVNVYRKLLFLVQYRRNS